MEFLKVAGSIILGAGALILVIFYILGKLFDLAEKKSMEMREKEAEEYLDG